MNTITRHERAITLHGVEARAFGVVTAGDGRILNQRIGASRYYTEEGRKYRIMVDLRFDDSCGNGHESFAITAQIDQQTGPGRYREESGGCLHEEIARHFPELTPLIKWHLTSTDGPMHYLANTIYHAGDRDHNGLRAGERRQIRNGRTGELCWTLEAVNAEGVKISTTPTGEKYRDHETVPLFILDKDARGDGENLPPVPVLKWVPLYTDGEGKPRQLDYARSSAVWPEATDEQLSVEPAELRAALIARLPALLAEFKEAMLGCGFIYPEPRA